MRKTTELFLINGKPMLAPDAEMQVNYEDLDDSDSGRDEAGYMHRHVLRYKVPVWTFSYQSLTEEEKQYMESLFPDTPTFQFTCPSRLDASVAETHTCYRSKYGITWKSARTGLWMGYSFQIITC